MSPGGGELSLSVCPGVGNRTSSTQMPGGVPGGEMVTGRIEPRIISRTNDRGLKNCWISSSISCIVLPVSEETYKNMLIINPEFKILDC